MSKSSSIPEKQSRERISDDRIFFIELGFGNDSHGQVRSPLPFSVVLDFDVPCSMHHIMHYAYPPKRIKKSVVDEGRDQSVQERDRIQFDTVHTTAHTGREFCPFVSACFFFFFLLFRGIHFDKNPPPTLPDPHPHREVTMR
jgi:hypothetical protein